MSGLCVFSCGSASGASKIAVRGLVACAALLLACVFSACSDGGGERPDLTPEEREAIAAEAVEWCADKYGIEATPYEDNMCQNGILFPPKVPEEGSPVEVRVVSEDAPTVADSGAVCVFLSRDEWGELTRGYTEVGYQLFQENPRGYRSNGVWVEPSATVYNTFEQHGDYYVLVAPPGARVTLYGTPA